MKQIFNWVHRKFHLNVDSHSFSHIKDGISQKAQNVKKAETVTGEDDTNKLLDQVALPHVQEGWKDGLLSIGTFGFDPLNHYNHLNGHFLEQRDDDDDDEEEEYPVKDDEADNYKEEGNEELNPLVVEVFKREFEKVLHLSSASARKPDLSMTVDDDIDTPLLRFLESAEVQNYQENLARNEIEQEKKKRERTTLADLFSAEADSGNSYSGIVSQPAADRLEKPSCRKKHGLSFPKKMLSRKTDDPPPIRKLHRLIKRLLKKKIHPDLEGKVNEMNDPLFNTLNSEVGGGDAAAPNESSFLLQGCEL